MHTRAGVPLGPLTTLGVGGPADRLTTCVTEAEIIEAVLDADSGDSRGRAPLLLLGGGSNVVLPDSGWSGPVVRLASRGVTLQVLPDGTVALQAQAGEPWDALVELAVSEGLGGLESLSGIPGLTGATPVQNVGAYGHDVAETVASVRVLDRVTRQVDTLSAQECGFGYRTSRFKHSERWVVLGVEFHLRAGASLPVRYAELARALDVAPGTQVPVGLVRDAVLRLRRGKGMVLDPADPDTRSVGSFFTNPVVPADVAAAAAARPGGAGLPRFPEPDGRVKLSAAWLIEHAGISRGWQSGSAGVSSKHALALISRPGGSAADLLGLADTVRSRVEQTWGISLAPEPRIVVNPPEVAAP